MKSFFAQLRSLVLPFGATGGQRIVLDGVNGVINIYGSTGTLVAQIDATGFASYSSTFPGQAAFMSAGGGQASLEVAAADYPGQVTNDGQIYASRPDAGDDSRPAVVMQSPFIPGGTNAIANIFAKGRGLLTDSSEVRLTADAVVFEGPASATSTVTITGGDRLDLGTWKTYSPAWTASTTNPTIGNGTISGRYIYKNKHTVLAVVRIAMGTTTTKGTGSYKVSLPVAAADSVGFGATGAFAINDSGSALRTGSVVFTSTTTVEFWINASGGAVAAATLLGAVSGSVIEFAIEYEV